nr:ABC transporter permease [Pseudomonas sp.]
MIGRLGWVLQALLSHWRRHPLQAACLVVGLWLATALWTGVQALNTQARDSYDRAAQLFGGGVQAVLVSPAGQRIDQSWFVTLRRQGWPVSPVLQGSVQVALGDGVRRLQLTGLEPLTLPNDGSLGQALSVGNRLLDFITSPGTAWLASDTLKEFRLVPGELLTLTDGRQLPPVHGDARLPPGVVLVDIGLAQQLLDAPGQLSELLVDPVFAEAEPSLPPGIPLVWEWREEGDLERLTDSFHLNLTALGLLAFVVGLFIVHAAASLAIEQRRGLLQTLRACGTSLPMLACALSLELLMLALLGGSLGVVSGFGLAALLVGDLAGSLRGLYGAQVAAMLTLDLWWWLAGLAMALLGTLAAGSGALLKALRVPLLGWSRPQAWRVAQRRSLWRLSVAGVVLWAIAVLLIRAGDGLLAGFALLAAVLLGSAWLLPLLLRMLLDIGQRFARGPVSQWFWADAQQQLSGLSLAFMALLLALATNIGVGSMTEGFRLTFNGWLDQRLAADIYLRPEHPEQGHQILDWLGSRPEVESVLPSWQVQTRIEGWPTEVSGIQDHPLYRSTWPVLEIEAEGWEALFRGESALISEQLGYSLGIGVGDQVTLMTPTGPWMLEVGGRYADYGNPRGQLLLSAGALQARWPGLELSSLGILVADGAVTDTVEVLQERFGLGSNRVLDQAALKTYSQQVFEQTFAATSALNTLTLGVAAVALLTSLLSLADARLGQLAPLWAMGLRSSSLAGLSLAQMLLLAIITWLTAIPLGKLLAWCLVDVVNVQAFGWRLPLYWFPMQWLQLGVMALLAVLLASTWPLWRILHSGTSALLRRFANDS